MQQLWCGEDRRYLVCIDSYENGVPAGRLYSPNHSGSRFQSLSQLLFKMEEQLDQAQQPQAYTAPRRFFEVLDLGSSEVAPQEQRKGKLATFELSILFRQHSSWQGTLYWREEDLERSFRSVLELIQLLDNALRSR